MCKPTTIPLLFRFWHSFSWGHVCCFTNNSSLHVSSIYNNSFHAPILFFCVCVCVYIYSFKIALVIDLNWTGRYESAFNRFVDEINAICTYQWWEGSVYSILCILAYPLAWSWQQWRRRMKLQRLREFVRSEYDHACLRSCRSRALYEGLKVGFR